MAVVLAAPLLGCIPGTKLPFTSPIDDTTAERWCGVAVEGSAIYGEFTGDLDAQLVPVAETREIGPPMSSFGDRGFGVRAWQEHLAMRGFPPGPIDGIHGPLTERATTALLKSRSVARMMQSEAVATSWATDYSKAKGVVEDHRPGILALCQGEHVTKEDLLREGFEPAAEAFKDIVELHRDVTLLERSGTYDHQAILNKLRIVQAEALAALAEE